MRNTYVLMFLGAVLFLSFVSFIQKQKPFSFDQTSSDTPSAVLGAQTETDGCEINGSLPDSKCTPGAAFPAVKKEQICNPEYIKSFKAISGKKKEEVFAAYGISASLINQYELDYLIPLELGGSDDLANLWPQSVGMRPGFHEKNQVEDYLYNEVCQDKITLIQAQQAIASDWLTIYKHLSE